MDVCLFWYNFAFMKHLDAMITIIGPTACGKTTVATALAHRMDGEVISADSRQVYRGMTIGTGKDLDDYVVDGHAVPYHLIDICEPGEKYNIYLYQKDFYKAYRDVMGRGRQVVLCGGSGLYVEAVLRGYALSPVPQNAALRAALEGKPLSELSVLLKELKQRNGSVMHNTTDVDTAQRAIRAIEIEQYNVLHPEALRQMPAVPSLVVGLDIAREERRRRISERLKARLQEGMVEEVKGLLDSGLTPESLIYYGLEYKYVTLYLTGQLTYQQMEDELEIAIHQFAKRQMTWFRGMERRGVTIHWVDAMLPLQEKVNRIVQLWQDYDTTDKKP